VGDGNKFKNCRVEIELDNDTPTIVRMRSDRLMFKASRTDNGWQPVGFPNIKKQDVERLEHFNEVESINFENVAEQSSKKANPYTVHRRAVKIQEFNRCISL
jgi:hypothetical protein